MNYLKKLKLRDYQETAIESLEHFYTNKPKGRGYLHIATGGGKTLVTNYYLMKNWFSQGKRVLWLAPDWTLLEQASSNLIQDFNINKDTSIVPCYIAGSKSEQTQNISKYLVELDDIIDAVIPQNVQIMYTTLQTMNNWILPKGFKPDLIVIDEAHWGKGGSLEKNIFQYSKKHSIPILGLSGTPKRREDWEVIHSIPFQALVGKHLAKPIFYSVSTGIGVDATIDKAQSIFNFIQQEVYNTLAENDSRNQTIIDYYRPKMHGKTIVFAINIEHANLLAHGFSKLGYNVYPIHSHIKDSKEAIQNFRDNPEYQIAVTVNMLNQGVDIPSVETLFITRPVTSDILYSQMIGRGARKDESIGKSEFKVVDFEDNFLDEELRRMIFEPKIEYFGSQATKSIFYNKNGNRSYSYRPHPNIKFPVHFSEFTPDLWEEFSFEILSIPLLTHQTFGLEFELTTRDLSIIDDFDKWTEKTTDIFQIMQQSLPKEFLGIKGDWGNNCTKLDYTKFNLVYDGSCGWEIVTPVLKGIEGFKILKDFLESFEKNLTNNMSEITVNYATGLHVHFGYKLHDLNVDKILASLWKIEPMVGCLVPPSRFNGYDPEDDSYDPLLMNDYCEPLRVFFNRASVNKITTISGLRKKLSENGNEINRYLTVNFKNLFEEDSLGTIEIRMHSGTLDSKKVLCWVSLWMGILNQAQKSWHFQMPDVDMSIEMPTEYEFQNFSHFFKEYLPESYVSLIENYLDPRAQKLLADWKKKIFTNIDAA